MKMTYEERKEQAIRDLEEEAKELSGKISDFFNTFSLAERVEALNQAMDCEHRTLQQTFTKFMVERFLHMASEDYHTDGRNQASKDLAKALKGILEKIALPMI